MEAIPSGWHALSNKRKFSLPSNHLKVLAKRKNCQSTDDGFSIERATNIFDHIVAKYIWGSRSGICFLAEVNFVVQDKAKASATNQTFTPYFVGFAGIYCRNDNLPSKAFSLACKGQAFCDWRHSKLALLCKGDRTIHRHAVVQLRNRWSE